MICSHVLNRGGLGVRSPLDTAVAPSHWAPLRPTVTGPANRPLRPPPAYPNGRAWRNRAVTYTACASRSEMYWLSDLPARFASMYTWR